MSSFFGALNVLKFDCGGLLILVLIDSHNLTIAIEFRVYGHKVELVVGHVFDVNRESASIDHSLRLVILLVLLSIILLILEVFLLIIFGRWTHIVVVPVVAHSVVISGSRVLGVH